MEYVHAFNFFGKFSKVIVSTYRLITADNRI